jgi:hypothetical protein
MMGTGGFLHGTLFCSTGLDADARRELEAFATQHGGAVHESLLDTTTHLVVGRAGSAKLRAAQRSNASGNTSIALVTVHYIRACTAAFRLVDVASFAPGPLLGLRIALLVSSNAVRDAVRLRVTALGGDVVSDSDDDVDVAVAIELPGGKLRQAGHTGDLNRREQLLRTRDVPVTSPEFIRAMAAGPTTLEDAIAATKLAAPNADARITATADCFQEPHAVAPSVDASTASETADVRRAAAQHRVCVALIGCSAAELDAARMLLCSLSMLRTPVVCASTTHVLVSAAASAAAVQEARSAAERCRIPAGRVLRMDWLLRLPTHVKALCVETGDGWADALDAYIEFPPPTLETALRAAAGDERAASAHKLPLSRSPSPDVDEAFPELQIKQIVSRHARRSGGSPGDPGSPSGRISSVDQPFPAAPSPSARVPKAPAGRRVTRLRLSKGAGTATLFAGLAVVADSSMSDRSVHELAFCLQCGGGVLTSREALQPGCLLVVPHADQMLWAPRGGTRGSGRDGRPVTIDWLVHCLQVGRLVDIDSCYAFSTPIVPRDRAELFAAPLTPAVSPVLKQQPRLVVLVVDVDEFTAMYRATVEDLSGDVVHDASADVVTHAVFPADPSVVDDTVLAPLRAAVRTKHAVAVSTAWLAASAAVGYFVDEAPFVVADMEATADEAWDGTVYITPETPRPTKPLTVRECATVAEADVVVAASLQPRESILTALCLGKPLARPALLEAGAADLAAYLWTPGALPETAKEMERRIAASSVHFARARADGLPPPFDSKLVINWGGAMTPKLEGIAELGGARCFRVVEDDAVTLADAICGASTTIIVGPATWKRHSVAVAALLQSRGWVAEPASPRAAKREVEVCECDWVLHTLLRKTLRPLLTMHLVV